MKQEIIDRALALITQMAERQWSSDPHHTHFIPRGEFDEARRIFEMMKPPSQVVLAARDVVASVHEAGGYTNLDRSDLDAGKFDDQQPMKIAVAAIKQGIQMGVNQKNVC